MTRKQIYDWCAERVNLKRDYTWFRDGAWYRITFGNGDTYEWKQEETKKFCQTVVTIWINGEMVSRSLYEEGWLENGSWGYRVICELPIEKAA